MPAALPSSLVSVGDRAAVGARRRTAPLDHAAAVPSTASRRGSQQEMGRPCNTQRKERIENKSHGPRENNGDAIKRCPIHLMTGARLAGNDSQQRQCCEVWGSKHVLSPLGTARAVMEGPPHSCGEGDMQARHIWRHGWGAHQGARAPRPIPLRQTSTCKGRREASQRLKREGLSALETIT